MRTLTSNFFIALDGVVEAPDQWHFPYFNDEMGAVIGAGMADVDAILMGRVLYEEWSRFWPNAGEEVGELGPFFNDTRKYAVSSTLGSADWNNTTVVPDLDAVTALKAQDGGRIMMSGSPTLARSLLRAGLVDELSLLIHPLAVGHGQRLFNEGETLPLQLVHSATLSTGVLHVTYAPA
jgi:dihydrofolate reductase